MTSSKEALDLKTNYLNTERRGDVDTKNSGKRDIQCLRYSGSSSTPPSRQHPYKPIRQFGQKVIGLHRLNILDAVYSELPVLTPVGVKPK